MEGAKHYDEGKLGFQWILSFPALREVAKVGDFGAWKYGQNNHRGGAEYMRYTGSCCRHLIDFICGRDLDRDDKCKDCQAGVRHKEHSGFHHLAHLAYDSLIILNWVLEGRGVDDRYVAKSLEKYEGVRIEFPSNSYFKPL